MSFFNCIATELTHLFSAFFAPASIPQRDHQFWWQDFLRCDLSSLGAVRLLYLDHTGCFASRASHIEVASQKRGNLINLIWFNMIFMPSSKWTWKKLWNCQPTCQTQYVWQISFDSLLASDRPSTSVLRGSIPIRNSTSWIHIGLYILHATLTRGGLLFWGNF